MKLSFLADPLLVALVLCGPNRLHCVGVSGGTSARVCPMRGAGQGLVFVWVCDWLGSPRGAELGVHLPGKYP